MIIFVDIDKTICINKDMNYNISEPYLDKIKKINELYENGHTIVYWTARGTKTGIKWFKVTYEQLNKWGCKFHELRMGKPVYDLFIDDKALNSINSWNYIDNYIKN